MRKAAFCIVTLLLIALMSVAIAAETFEIYPNAQAFPYDLSIPDCSGFTYTGEKDAEGRYVGTITVDTGNADVESVYGYYIYSENGPDGFIYAEKIGKGVFQLQVPEGYPLEHFEFWFARKNNVEVNLIIGPYGNYPLEAHFMFTRDGKESVSITMELDEKTGISDGAYWYYFSCDSDYVTASYDDSKLHDYEYDIINHQDVITGSFNNDGTLSKVTYYIEASEERTEFYQYSISSNTWVTYNSNDWKRKTTTDPGLYDINKIIRYLNARAGGLQIRPTDVSRDFSKDGGTEVKNGLVNENGQWVLYKDGMVDTDTYGIIEYNGGRFFVANGVIIPNSGLVSDGSAWYYLSSGQVADYTGLATYDGAWFYVTNGMLDTNRNGIVSYDGAQFMLAAGRIVTEANGLIQDPVTGKWYFVSAGQVASNYRGLALYDGQWFYVWDGVFQSDAEGWVEHDGAMFYVVNGMVTGN